MKYALVTGAYGGMGRATVQALAKNGFCVFALDKKVDEPIKNVVPI
jgi:NAD(P)-dependent dehydrogenase (short-subunit alcohol dehydrogenase family)